MILYDVFGNAIRGNVTFLEIRKTSNGMGVVDVFDPRVDLLVTGAPISWYFFKTFPPLIAVWRNS